MERVTCKCGHTWMLGGGGRNVVCSQCGRPQGDGAQGAENKPAEATTIAGLTMIDPREPPEIDSAALADVERTGESAPRATSETAGDELVTPGMHAGGAAPKSFVRQIVTDLKRVWCWFRARRRSRIETQNGEYNWSSRLIGRIQPFIDPRAFLLAWLGFMPFCCCLGMAPLSLLSHEYAKPRAVNWEFYEILGRVLYWPIILADSKSILKEANVLLVFAVQYGYFYLIALAFVKLSTRR